MVILGIDPGTSIVGYAVIKKTAAEPLLIEAGAIKPKSKSAPKKLAEIHAAVSRIIDIHRPDIVALEKIFFSKNIKTALTVSEARGVLLLTAETKKLRVCEYAPLEVKMAVTGYGRADKRQVGGMVKIILKQDAVPALDDITDAMAVAITALQEK